MINLSQRSSETEIMDRDDIPFADMAQTLKELNIINTRLGGHAITIAGLKSLIDKNTPLHVCEIGCGGGDNLQAIAKYCAKEKLEIKFTGIDMNRECINYAQQRYSELPCKWICSDYSKIDLTNDPPTLIFTSLFCHHFSNEQLVFMLQWLSRNSRNGFFINDLQRHWLAFYLIKYITKFFSRSYLVKNDASISVARSFHRSEWEKLFRDAGLNNHSIQWKWAFRYLVIHKN
jgi:2-polyprenyl-3-methyl-5-hydroxy-6-metoxy-1,4-benzoquinol methylase